MDLVLDELLLLPLHHPLEMVQLLLVVNQHLVALQKEQVLHQHHPSQLKLLTTYQRCFLIHRSLKKYLWYILN